MKHKWSAVIITRNEEKHLSSCIQSIQGITDDIIVVDSGSTDDTISIAESHGAQVYEIGWNGYGANKNFGTSKAKHNWIISIDGDEVISDSLKESILSLEPDRGSVYLLNSLVNYAGTWIKHCGWYPRYKIRIFNREDCLWDDAKVHENLTPLAGMKQIKLSGDLLHYSYNSIHDHEKRITDYARLRAEGWIENNQAPSLSKRYFGSWFQFIKTYIVKLGFLDGHAGWTISKMNAKLSRLQIKFYDESVRS